MNVKVLNMITGRNESKSLVKHIAYDCKCRFDGKNCKKIKNGIKIYVDKNLKSD